MSQFTIKQQHKKDKIVTCTPQTERHTDRQTRKVKTEGTISGFHEFFLQPIIKERSNKEKRQKHIRRKWDSNPRALD